MFASTFDGSHINVLIAFAGGVITFFASCLLPLVPTYLAYLAGLSTSDISHMDTNQNAQKRVFVHGVVFTIGFIIVFIVLGAAANTFGRLLVVYRQYLQQLGGVFFVLMGLLMLGIISPVALYKEHRITLQHISKFRLLNSLVAGLTFGFAWTPCIGPILAVILLWASQADTVVRGMSLLAAYGIGLGIPFILIAAVFEKATPLLMRTKRIGHVLHIASALIIIAVGIALIMGVAGAISMGILRIFHLNSLAV